MNESQKPDLLSELRRQAVLMIYDAADEIERLRAERDKLQKFKDWVHAYLDAQGVPHHPPGSHGAAGCRIGDRMDWLMSWLRKAGS